MATDVFYARFVHGEMGDNLPFIKWASCYELYLEARQEIDSQLAQQVLSYAFQPPSNHTHSGHVRAGLFQMFSESQIGL
ncbi:MAG: hypothetical protein Fur0021_10210 [Candidatus Promineifilaceae bacterium]